MNERATQGAKVERTKDGWRLGIQKGDSLHYRDAQLDDYSQLPRHKFPHRTLSLSLRAKASSSSAAGTWGFGLWNDPFGLSLGFGGSPFRLPALPNAVWFFYGSEENYLSFKSPSTTGFDTPSKNTRATQPTAQGEVAANGFMAQTFRSPKFHPLLLLAGLALPFSRKTARKLLSKVIQENGVSLWSSTACCRDMQEQAPALQSQGVDVTQWHEYRLQWSPKRVLFYVDDALVFESPVSPNPPLGLVIWIDNQYAAFTPEGKIGFGVLENPEPAWIEVQDIVIT
ncbi:MAG: family 16 glycosylhydrolase [Anaerolineales bacterium]|nr:family 16 glycosylhydrolase [Anaerolineales bacterium]